MALALSEQKQFSVRCMSLCVCVFLLSLASCSADLLYTKYPMRALGNRSSHASQSKTAMVVFPHPARAFPRTASPGCGMCCLKSFGYCLMPAACCQLSCPLNSWSRAASLQDSEIPQAALESYLSPHCVAFPICTLQEGLLEPKHDQKTESRVSAPS